MSIGRRLARAPLAVLGLLGRAIAVVLVAAVALLAWLVSTALTVLRYASAIARIVLGGWLLLFPQLRSGPTGVLMRATAFVATYLAFWVVIWWLQWCGLAGWWERSATWFVESRSGMQTALQVLPATVVALLVFVLGAIFVVAQLAITAYGQRAAVLLGLDQDVQTAVVRPLLLAAAALLLAGQVPDAGGPAPATTAAVATCVLATIALFFRAALLLVALLGRYTGPRAFPQYVVEPIYDELADGATGLVVLRGPLLGEALKAALRRGDSVAVRSTLEAIMGMQTAYLKAVQVRPSVRSHTLEDGSARDNWLAEDLTDALVAAGEDALKMFAPAEDANQIGRALTNLASAFLRAGEYDAAARCISGLIELATTSHQITPSGVTNHYAQPVGGLAQIVGVAEEMPADPEADHRTSPARELAAEALAGWLLAIAYSSYHFGLKEHSQWDRSFSDFGEDPPWDEARAIVQSYEWQRTWANKQYRGPKPVLDWAKRARREHASRAGRP